MNKQIIIGGFFITLLLGVGGGYWMASMRLASVSSDKSEISAEKKPLYFRNPMNPAITSSVPAKDEMGMDYIPVYDETKKEDEPSGTVTIDPVTVQNIGVRTHEAKKQILSRTIRTVGRVDYNEAYLARMHPKTEGWIESMRIDKTGEPVKKDAILLSLYSPQLVSSQEEYLLAIKNQKALEKSPFADIRKGAEDLVRTARERLEFLDVPEHQIRELERDEKIHKNLHIHSPFDGIVMNVGARKGQYVTPKTELYMIANLSKVWAYVDVYEYELPWVNKGDRVDMTLAGIPGKTFRGQVTYIYPYAEKKTRSIKVRLEFENPDLLLKPDMFADVTIHASRVVNAVVIPAEAVVRSGIREQVFIIRGPGKFEPREVQLGVSANGLVEVIKGVEEGEKVVTSAQFLIDSESKLREATAKMLESMKKMPAPYKGRPMDHEGKVDDHSMHDKDSNHLNMDHNGMKNHEEMSRKNMDHGDMQHD